MGKVATNSAKKAPSKSEVLAAISEATNVSKKEVSAVLEALGNEIKKAMSGKGSGSFAIPGLVKIEKKKVPASLCSHPAQGWVAIFHDLCNPL